MSAIVKEPTVAQYHRREKGEVKTLCGKTTGPLWSDIGEGILPETRICLTCRIKEGWK